MCVLVFGSQQCYTFQFHLSNLHIVFFPFFNYGFKFTCMHPRGSHAFVMKSAVRLCMHLFRFFARFRLRSREELVLFPSSLPPSTTGFLSPTLYTIQIRNCTPVTCIVKIYKRPTNNDVEKIFFLLPDMTQNYNTD